MTRCANCNEARADVERRAGDSGAAVCGRCHDAGIAYGRLHVPEAFTCEDCGGQLRTEREARAGLCAACEQAWDEAHDAAIDDDHEACCFDDGPQDTRGL